MDVENILKQQDFHFTIHLDLSPVTANTIVFDLVLSSTNSMNQSFMLGICLDALESIYKLLHELPPF
jgi:hypothetical protein